MIFIVDQRRGAVLALKSLSVGAAFKRLVAASTIGPMQKPGAIAFTADQRLLIADSGKNRLVVLDPATGASAALASNTSAIGPLSRPAGIAARANGQFVVADTGNHRIVFGDSQTAPHWSSYGTPGATSPGGFEAPTSVHVDAMGRILVADSGADRLVRIDAPDGSGWKELPLPAGANKPRPYALATGPGGHVLVSDLANSRVLLLAADDTMSVLIDGQAGRSLFAPVALAMSANDIVIADAAAGCVTRWSLGTGKAWTSVERLDGRGGVKGGPEFASLSGLAVGGAP